MGDTFGEFLKQLRLERGYSLREAKEQTGISEAYLWQLENGKREIPRPETVRRLAKGYGVPEETFLNYAGYLTKPADAKTKDETAKTHLFRDYEKLSPDGKRMLGVFLAGLRQAEEKKK